MTLIYCKIVLFVLNKLLQQQQQHAPIDCELYLEQPPGFVQGDGNNNVWKLKKSIYGLKQSGRNWNLMLHDYLTDNGFIQSAVDPCMYTRKANDSTVMMLVWVADILIAGTDTKCIDEVKRELKLKFNMSDFGTLSYFLGIEFKFGDNIVKMDQSLYLKKVLKRFGMEECKPRKTPCDHNFTFSNTDDKIVNVRFYRELVGSLIYAMTCTRPDISWIVSKLSQYLSCPTVEHHTCAKQVLHYIKGSLNYNLTFGKSDKPLSITGYSDSDWAGSVDDRKSISGYCFKLNGGLISWKSKKQNTIALSSCEAEYMGLTLAIQEGLFLIQLMKDMDTSGEYDYFTLYGDNQGSLALAKNPVKHHRSKHIDVRYHFIRDHIKKGTVDLHYVPTSDNQADVFTKALAKVSFEKCVNNLFG